MDAKESYLEKKFLFRFIKVAYVIAFLFLAIIIGILGWTQKPYKYLDDNKSYFTCLHDNNGGIYYYNKVDDWINKLPNSYELNIYDQKSKANYMCEQAIEEKLKYRQASEGYLQYLGPKGEVFSEYDNKWFENTDQNRKIIVGNVINKYSTGIYELHDVYSTNGSWSTVITWWVLGITFIYGALNLISETLLYVFFGKKFTWQWLKSFRLY